MDCVCLIMEIKSKPVNYWPLGRILRILTVRFHNQDIDEESSL